MLSDKAIMKVTEILNILMVKIIINSRKKAEIDFHIEVYYNRIRRHSSIGSIAPMVFESQCKKVA